MKLLSVVGARPNFMKIAPFCEAIKRYNQKGTIHIEHILVHTGQHYDQAMSDSFFESLGIPEPDVNLGVGSGSHAEQVGTTMIKFERVVRKYKPDWVVVVGDVNATLACAVTAKKEQVKLAHIEAGLRSFDLTMPEEINRIVTDRLSDLLFTTDAIASENLRKEGVSEKRLKEVGNVMIDTLKAHKERSMLLAIDEIVKKNAYPECKGLNVQVDNEDFAVITLHRPSNVDEKEILSKLVRVMIEDVSASMEVLWPVHPRTHDRLRAFGLWDVLCDAERVLLLQPIGYDEMLRLNISARVVFTDSGGVQEECCALGTPCLTLRWNTERPITLVEHGGVNILVGNDVDRLRKGYNWMLREKRHEGRVPPLWDGKTALRIVEILARSGACRS